MLATKAGDIDLRIPKLREGSFFPLILEPRRRIDQALYAAVMEANVAGVSTRSVDDLVAALGIDSDISKSEVSRICAGLDEVVTAFRTRRLDHTGFPYVYLDVTCLHVRNSTSQVVSMADVVATGITTDGGREVLGLDVGDSEDEVFWRGFLAALKRRGLSGVRLVISDQHAGLVAALKRSFQRIGHQRCRVHFARNLLAHVPKTHTDMVAAVFRTIFVQPDPATVAASWDEVRGQLAGRFPKIGTLMDNAKTEVLAFTAFPRPHWPKIWSTNPLERVNKEIKRRARVVGIFPTNLRSSDWSARSWPTCTTSGSQANAATSPRAPWPISPRPAILTPPPRSTAARRHRRSALNPTTPAGHCQQRPSMPRPGHDHYPEGDRPEWALHCRA